MKFFQSAVVSSSSHIRLSVRIKVDILRIKYEFRILMISIFILGKTSDTGTKIYIFTSEQIHFMMAFILLVFGGVLLISIGCMIQLKQKKEISRSNESTKFDQNKICDPKI